MEDKELKITIDAKGQVHREVIDRPAVEKKPVGRLNNLLSSLGFRKPIHENS